MCQRIRLGNTVAIICGGGKTYDIVAGGRKWRFEMHSFLGPMPVHRKTGNGIDGSKAFWEAVTLWHQQGKRVDDIGVCIWDRQRESA